MKATLGGIIIMDKPEGVTSTYVDRFVKKTLGLKKVGHIGTLDPFASGVLGIAVNYGTKAIPYIKTGRKIYEFEITFGEKTDTADKTGKVVETAGYIPTVDDILDIIPNFLGKTFQTPPAYSAIKINGKRAYVLARSGEKPQIKRRPIEIYGLKLLGQTSERTFKFFAEVSPGTYIRALSENIASSVNSLGHASSLRRIADGKFRIENAISLDGLEEKTDNVKGVVLSLKDVLDDIPVIHVSSHDAFVFSQGGCIKSSRYEAKPGDYLACSDDGFLGMVFVAPETICPKRIFENGKEFTDVDTASKEG